MSNERIIESLTRKFEENRVIFWYDSSSEFVAMVNQLQIDKARIINLKKIGSFEAKLFIETEDVEQKILVYAPFDCPPPDDDVLLDIFLYAGHFSADSAEIVRDELGLSVPETREFIKERLPFFTPTRKKELQDIIERTEDNDALGQKMIRVLLGARGHSTADLLLALFELANKQGGAEPKELGELSKFGLSTLFWGLVNRDFGYYSDNPSISSLLFVLISTDIAAHLGDKIPSALRSLVIGQQYKASNACVLMSSWRDSERYRRSYEETLSRASEELRLRASLSTVAPKLLVGIQTAEDIEVLLLERCRDILSGFATTADREEAELIILNRRNSYWSSIRPHFSAAYNAMSAALNLIKLKEEYPNGFIASDLKSFVALYIQELYRFDEEYRLYYRALAGDGVSGTLTPLTARVEELYKDWFLPTLASAWTPFVENDLLRDWEIPGIVNQYLFYSRVVSPTLNSTPPPRVAVIISDAFRYEAARALTGLLNRKDNFKAQLSTLLGVLPSHTALGMAALLPHETIDYDSSGSVLVDGVSAQGLANRHQILQRYGGIALSATDVKSQPRDELRERIGDTSLIYIYHDRIDETGDNQKSEREVFQAVEQTIEELDSIAAKALNSLNCGVVLITADHGFIFTDGAIQESERSEIEIHSGTPLIEKKRYVVGSNLDVHGSHWTTTTALTAKTATAFDVVVPRGVNRFHFKGGARYFHGGAMPQEILVPLIVVKKTRDKALDSTRTSKVDVVLLASTNRITSPRQSFKFIQTDLVTDKRLSRSVTVGFYEEGAAGLNPISDIHRLHFDATQENQGHREQTATFVFKSVKFDASKEYFLRIVDQETELELSRHSFQIRILIADEFN